MSKIKYDMALMKYMHLFESLTGSTLKDCILNDSQIIFIVNENEIGKSIGKKGSNVKRLEKVLKKKIKIVEFSDDVVQFVYNLLLPMKVKDITNDNGSILIVGGDVKTRGQLIGRNGRNLEVLKNIITRYFKIESIKIV